MKPKKGQIQVSTENIFPIIRQWLYSEQDIFLRELVSNAADAIAKLQRYKSLGEAGAADAPAGRIEVILDQDPGTLTIRDNGIGMTADEMEKYINQIAYSGIVDFVNKVQEKEGEQANIIGHFGLGFYSSFMVSDKVEIDSLSYVPGSTAAHWMSEEGIDFELSPSGRTTVGTDIILTLSEEAKKTYTSAKIREILRKYCGFMAVPIYFTDVKAEAEQAAKAAEAAKEAAAKAADDGQDGEQQAAAPDVPEKKPLNNTDPLWNKPAREISDDEYIEFYRDTFFDYREPLFWVHLNMDYPFRLKGILYFPQTDSVYESLEGRIKIYYNQVFVADNIQEIIPDFLFLLQGCLDCPDLPLNVSRSFLQSDETVKKLSGHIVRKVADKLTQLIKEDRAQYDRYWKDIAVFVKYGMMKEDAFYDRVRDALLFKTTDARTLTLDELGEGTVFYTPEIGQLVPYVELATAAGKPVVVMDHELDNQFMSFLEYKLQQKVRFKRVDAELGGQEQESTALFEPLTELFREVLQDDQIKVSCQALGDQALPVLFHESEESRRMAEMRKQLAQMRSNLSEEELGTQDLFPVDQTLVLNTDQPVITRLAAMQVVPDLRERAQELAASLVDLAKLGNGTLTGDGLSRFLRQNSRLLTELASAQADQTETEASV